MRKLGKNFLIQQIFMSKHGCTNVETYGLCVEIFWFYVETFGIMSKLCVETAVLSALRSQSGG